MPKDRRVSSSSFDRAMVSPYACSSLKDGSNYKSSSLPAGDAREWEEARCPICMEHPHNAVLLLCSSQDKGCRPFMCDTSYRHSNCLDQFRKSSASSAQEEQPELVCPLCRGMISGWIVIEPARKFMNSKARSCSLETCNISGDYIQLRKHARLDHPSDRPSEASPVDIENSVLPEEIEEKLSSTEKEYFKNHAATLQSYMSDVDLHLTVDMVPPKDPYIKVRVLDDIGEVVLSDQVANLARYAIMFLRRTDVEQYITQGQMEELTS